MNGGGLFSWFTNLFTRKNRGSNYVSQMNQASWHYGGKSRRIRKHGHRKRSGDRKRGGDSNLFLKPFSNSSVGNVVDCSKMNVDVIQDPKTLHSKYQVCCPKNVLGMKNSSPICKKIEQKYKQLLISQNQNVGTYGYNDESNTVSPNVSGGRRRSKKNKKGVAITNKRRHP